MEEGIKSQDNKSSGIKDQDIKDRGIRGQENKSKGTGTQGIRGHQMAKEFLKIAGKEATLTEEQLRTYSPLSFAYIGDVVYELVIRTMIVSRGNMNSNRYHHEAIRYVNASAQKDLMEAILPSLSEEEMKIYRRGQNAKPATTAKNQSRRDYHIATGFETLMGYLYLAGRTDRILELIQDGIDKAGIGK
jgi:ribonuclease-3 family protein